MSHKKLPWSLMNEKNSNITLSPYLSLLYGGIAGSVAKTIIAPFDRVKIHFQIAHPDLYEFRGNVNGVFSAIRRIYLHSGFLGLYRGHSATLARIIPYAAINFAAFEKFKIVFEADIKTQNWPWRKLLAGSMAGTLAVSVTYPFDIIRARIAYDISNGNKNSNTELNSFKTAFRKLFEESKYSRTQMPFGGFYQGFLATILGIIPYAGVSFFAFEYSKQFLINRQKSENLSSVKIFFSGLFAGAMGQTVAYPFDVVRRRMQLFRLTEHLPAQHYDSGIITAIKSIIKTHGLIRGIFSGLSINYMKVAPASGISFLVYETLKKKYPDGLFFY